MSILRVEQIMGMPIAIDARDGSEDPTSLEPIFDWFGQVDQLFSTYKFDSEISRLNAGRIQEPELNPYVVEVLARCQSLCEETNGYFNIRTDTLPVPLELPSGQTVTGGVDPSGYVKGWAVEMAANLMRGQGRQNFMINAGGDIRVKGDALPQTSWRLGIQHPRDLGTVAAVMQLSEGAVATSGEYIRGMHIVDPHTGRPPDGILSVTVTGPDLGTADAYATAAFAMGEEGPRWTLGLDGYEAMCIMENDLVLTTPGFPRASVP